MKFFNFILLAILFSGCSFFKKEDPTLLKKEDPLSKEALLEYQTCQINEDCVYAQNGSCDCNNGGEATAINRQKSLEFKLLFKEIPCTLKGGPWCPKGIATCVKNRCLWTKLPHIPEDSPQKFYPPPPPAINR